MGTTREEFKKEILKELKEEFLLIPIQKNGQIITSDIFDKYIYDICNKLNIENNYSNRNAVTGAIRKVVAMKMGYLNATSIPQKDFKIYRKELDNFIQNYILKHCEYPKCPF